MDRSSLGALLFVGALAIGLTFSAYWALFVHVPGYVPAVNGYRLGDYIAAYGTQAAVWFALIATWLYGGRGSD